MGIEVITQEDLAEFRETLLQDIKALFEKYQPARPLKSSEVRQLLGISLGTLQNLRLNGTLPFQKIGGTLYYSRQDIEQLLSKNGSTSLSHRSSSKNLES